MRTSDSIRADDRPALTPQALEEFEEILRSWVEQNLGSLEEGGLGNYRPLAEAVVKWTNALADRRATP
jgi:hypothetical protein